MEKALEIRRVKESIIGKWSTKQEKYVHEDEGFNSIIYSVWRILCSEFPTRKGSKKLESNNRKLVQLKALEEFPSFRVREALILFIYNSWLLLRQICYIITFIRPNS